MTSLEQFRALPDFKQQPENSRFDLRLVDDERLAMLCFGYAKLGDNLICAEFVETADEYVKKWYERRRGHAALLKIEHYDARANVVSTERWTVTIGDLGLMASSDGAGRYLLTLPIVARVQQ